MQEIYRLVIFFLIQGIINPSIEDFTYFFLMDVIGISKLLFAVL